MGNFVEEVKKEDLHPPRAPTNVMYEKAMERLEQPKEKGKGFDFSYLVNNSSFQRGMIEWIKHEIPGFQMVKVREGKDAVKVQIDDAIEVYEEIHDAIRGSKADYRNVMKEFKEVLAKRKEVIEK